MRTYTVVGSKEVGVVDILAVDHPVLLPGPTPQRPVWDQDPTALLAVAMRRLFPGPMLELGARDGLVAMVCRLTDPDQPVFAVPASEDADQAISRACAINELAIGRGLPEVPLTLVVARTDPTALHARIVSDRPALLMDCVAAPPAGYDLAVAVDGDTQLFVPTDQVRAAQHGVEQALATRAAARPAWLNAGTQAALRLLELQTAAAAARETELQTRVRRAYDQMRDARDQMIRLRLRKRR
ncbi:MAG: hypothetical protein U0R27_12885 [Candidatus Nanopelagicales bacterium]|nr:hypothetical protein [Actinomycetota bacterium]HNE87711.1 hypothetical protein [Actinomycetota bacterium]HNL50361.1 hypothetical protein [Actinomycetota bacterium]HNO14626.1 hypothetical protein [Actinomycetota bacterium]HUM85787.1 hypothetical protein [Actinomycetota bacterium]